MFDNIPLTKLCLEQGGYDWGVLAYAVGFGGYIFVVWFISRRGTINMYPEARSAGELVTSWLACCRSICDWFSSCYWRYQVGHHMPHAKASQENIVKQETIIKPNAS